jgi:hypothetical protein
MNDDFPGTLAKNRNAFVWFLMVTAVGIHVIDEAVTGFLPFYNEQVLALRVRRGRRPDDGERSRSPGRVGVLRTAVAGVLELPVAAGDELLDARAGHPRPLDQNA